MIQFMRSTSSAAASQAPLLQAGQPFYETDTHKLKIGDGNTAWNDLPYIGGSGSTSYAKYATVTVGTSTAGYTVDQVDYLCDGVDDQVEIAAAINSVTNERSSVYIMPGSYLLSNAITIEDSNFDIDIFGAGLSTILKNSKDNAFISSHRSGSIHDISISGNASLDDATYAIVSQSSSSFDIYRVSFRDISGCISSRGHVYDCGIYCTRYNNNVSSAIYGCTNVCRNVIWDTNTAIESSLTCVIEGNYIMRARDWAIDIPSSYREVVVSNNVISTCVNGIRANGSNCAITGNIVSGWGSGDGKAFQTLNMSNSTFCGNTFWDFAEGLYVLHTAVTGNVFANNIFVGNDDGNTTFNYAGSNSIFSGNIFKGITPSGGTNNSFVNNIQ